MNTPLRGKTVAFSGSFSSLGQGKLSGKLEAMAKARAMGAKVTNHIAKGTQILVTGDGNVGVKKKLALHNGAKILPANSFLKFVHAGGAKKMAAASGASSPKAKMTSKIVARPSFRSKAAVPLWKVDPKIKAQNQKAVAAFLDAKVPISAIYGDKTPAEIERMEKEAAKFGPMPWLKSKADQKKKTARRTLKLKTSSKVQACPLPVADTPMKAAPAAIPDTVPTTALVPVVATTPVKQAPATPVVAEASPSITFTPSKGLTISFQGDFAEFCRAAQKVVIARESAVATTVAEKLIIQ